MTIEFREAFRSLWLPVSVNRETEAIDATEARMEEIGIAESDRAQWIRAGLESWRDGALEHDWRSALHSAIRAGDLKYGDAVATEYFSLHSVLKNDFLLSFDAARTFLSHSLLISRLSGEERMSSAQIASLLSDRDTRVGFSRQSVDKVVTKLRTKRNFTLEDVQKVFSDDAELEELLLADSDLPAAADAVAQIGKGVGVPINLSERLQTLADPGDLQRYSPYVQMLHYQCTIAEFFDHRVSDIYEFSPRSQRVNWLVEQYPDALVAAGNPFLNNAKSVESVNLAWARSKAAQYAGALCLVEILVELENLGFSSRQELAAWIRFWIHRVMRFARPITSQVPEQLTQPQIDALLEFIVAEESRTAGILEQRIVDALTSTMYTREDGWISRGLGDSVTATNTSRKKVGDCDYQKLTERRVVAFEAHGGALTQIYLHGHLSTLPKALAPRQEEWFGFSSPEEWAVDIEFIAHEILAETPEPMQIDGTTVRFRLRTFNQLAADIAGGNLADAVRRYICDPVNEKRTPNRVRAKLREMIGLPADGD